MKKIAAIIFLISIVLLFGVIAFQTSESNPFSTKKESAELPTRALASETKSFHSSITIAAIGDILIHRPVYEDAKAQDGSYNFKPMIENVMHLLSEPDFTIANQESIIGGTEIGLSSYPSFNSPYEVADAFKEAGVDLMTMANNHTLDRGEKAILNAISHYNKIGMHYVGSYESEQDANTLRIINVQGIKLGFLSYTYGTNGIPVPKGKNHLVSLIDQEKIKQDLQKLKSESDVIIVNMHWGLEYQSYPSNEQKELAKFLANEGAHVIIGHHPHVLQPMEWIENNAGDKSIVIYSLGNFLSAQKGNGKDVGGVFTLTIEKNITSNVNTITLKNPTLIPTFVSSQHSRNYRVDELETINSNLYQEVIAHMNQWIDDSVSIFSK
ncbi:CapA family protein [Bacillus kexueae]|uniref:CapA family protein n=1 Tax=Aeribacillus kexueae TaxID=2078952 RepID=UPI001FAF8D14|nr:CapA family protein [Bacillus kexueae]